MKPKKGLSVYVLMAGIMALLIVAGFFGFQLVDEATKSQVPAKQRELVKSIDGGIEERATKNLQTRKIISRDEIMSIKPTKLPTPTQIITNNQIVSTQSAETASGSATDNL